MGQHEEFSETIKKEITRDELVKIQKLYEDYLFKPEPFIWTSLIRSPNLKALKRLSEEIKRIEIILNP